MPIPEALVFDMYGTLVDPMAIDQELARHLGTDARRVAEVWRQKQLEFTFRLTAMRRYEDFEQVTRKALDHALAATLSELSPEAKESVMDRYDSLERFADVDEGLQRLRNGGHTMMVLSNGSPRMLAAIIENARLRPLLDGFISVDELETYKPSPKVYEHAAERLGRPITQVRLVSSNPFDVIGAMAAGMQAAWVNRSGGLYDPLGPRPSMAVGSLVELADAVAAAAAGRA